MEPNRRPTLQDAAAKVPAVTFAFWLIKIAATTLGETGGDWVTMSLDLGYLVGTGIFAALFVVLVHAQVKAARFHCLGANQREFAMSGFRMRNTSTS